MPLPVPTLDHVVINTRDDMDNAAEIYRRLGFHLTARGYHTLGSINHLAMFVQYVFAVRLTQRRHSTLAQQF